MVPFTLNETTAETLHGCGSCCDVGELDNGMVKHLVRYLEGASVFLTLELITLNRGLIVKTTNYVAKT